MALYLPVTSFTMLMETFSMIASPTFAPSPTLSTSSCIPPHSQLLGPLASAPIALVVPVNVRLCVVKALPIAKYK